MNPAYQGFRTGQAFLQQAVFGLQVHDKLPFRQGSFHSVGNGLFAQQLAAEGIIIDGKKPVILAPDAVCRKQRPVAHLVDRDGTIRNLINAPTHNHFLHEWRKGMIRVIPKMLPVPLLLFPFLETKDVVSRKAAAEAGAANHAAGNLGNLFQQAVPFLLTEGIIDKFEIFNIGADNGIVLVRGLLQLLAHFLAKELHAVKTGKPVILELIHHCRSFTQLNQACHPVQDHLRAIWLGDKVRGAMGKRRHFIRFRIALRHNNDRDQRQFGILFDMVQKSIAIHHRHHDVQKNQRNTVLVLLQNIQRCLPVFRLQNLIFGGENFI